MEGFNCENVLHDLIIDGNQNLIKLILDDYDIEPSLDYLVVALTGKCPETMLLVLNRMVTKEQIISSLYITSTHVRVTDKMCYLVYLRACHSLGVLPHNVQEYALQFDSVTILKFTEYNNQMMVYDAILNGAKRIFKYCYQPNLSIPITILVNGYALIAKNNDISFLYRLIREYGVPDCYNNKHGKVGTIRMIENIRNVNK